MIKALLFDLNGTLIDILTSESDEAVYRTTANFLSYTGVQISPDKLKEEYFNILHQQKNLSDEEFPEFDVVELFARIIEKYRITGTAGGDPAVAARVFRAAGRYKLELYPQVRETLMALKQDFRMAAVSDGQSIWALPELSSTGLGKLFETVTISSDHGFRKPDRRMYEMTLRQMGLTAAEVIFVGNDMFRDVYGARMCGMKTIFFRSNQGDHDFRGAEADYIIYNFSELRRAVEFIIRKG